MSNDTVLVSSIGTGGYDRATYTYEGGTHKTKFSPVAVGELIGVDHALIARTEAAGQKYDDELERAFETIDVSCGYETIEVVEDRDDIDTRVGQLIDLIRERDPEQVVLDITSGFRSLPMVFFSAVLHLDAVADVKLDGIYYSEFRSSTEETPIVDMTHLHTLMEWYHAINTFERTGELRPVYALLKDRKEALFREDGTGRPTDLHDVVSSLRGTSQHLDTGLPLETGTAARSALTAMEAIDDSQFIGPEKRFSEPLSDLLDRVSVDSNINEQSGIVLDMGEIHRQREIVEFYAEHDRYRVALECARELFINRVILERGINLDDWIDHNTVRDTVTEQIAEQRMKQKDTDVEIAAISLWDKLREARNWYAHSGYKNEDAPSEDKISRALSELCEKVDDDEYWSEII